MYIAGDPTVLLLLSVIGSYNTMQYIYICVCVYIRNLITILMYIYIYICMYWGVVYVNSLGEI